MFSKKAKFSGKIGNLVFQTCSCHFSKENASKKENRKTIAQKVIIFCFKIQFYLNFFFVVVVVVVVVALPIYLKMVSIFLHALYDYHHWQKKTKKLSRKYLTSYLTSQPPKFIFFIFQLPWPKQRVKNLFFFSGTIPKEDTFTNNTRIRDEVSLT